MSQFFKNKGILPETTCPQTPQQNGVVERKNRRILEITCALLISVCAPKTYWANAMIYDVYLMNRMSSLVLSFRTHLAVAYVNLHKNQWSKLDLYVVRCVFIRFSPQQNRYRCYHPIPDIYTSPWMLPSLR